RARIESVGAPAYLEAMNDAPANLKFAAQSERLAGLRAAMAAAGVDGYIVPHADEHQNEYLAPYAERLAWLTGFTGSAGLAVILKDRAAIFIDGRYTLQVRAQTDGTLYDYRHLVDEPAPAWLAEHAKGAKVGYDPRLITPAQLARFEDAGRKTGVTFVALADNLVDRVWRDRPARPTAPAHVYPEKFAGRSGAEKRKLVAAWLVKEGHGGFVFSATDSVAWLFNIRGADVEFSPLVLAYALVAADGRATLFADPVKLSPEVIAHLGPDVTTAPYEGLSAALAALKGKAASIAYDRDTGSRWLADAIAAAGFEAKSAPDPITPIKAAKTAAELAGVRDAHVRDGAALTRFLAWFAREGQTGTLNEISAAARLEEFRRTDNLYRGGSFATICGAGGNGAIVHYRAHPATAARIAPDMLVLIDSGGQYLDGTTDVTRTVAVGVPTAEQKRRFTLVLKGHIALGSARFVKGTTGSQLDALARHALWQEGLDYDHGTGHGVGTYLGVHEGPQRISKIGNTVALEPGMVISNEPGYYKTGEYGIRIENLVAVRAAAVQPGAEKTLYEFETLTLAPIDLALVDVPLLTAPEKTWLNAYHARVRDTLSPLVDADTRAWLAGATAAI
ncbi:MAG: aminopeptidase P family protein, partial [Rhodospirillaceae bacterium]|nr:aminopeptidase P family protein [Rhodospirillaceae bacterium]